MNKIDRNVVYGYFTVKVPDEVCKKLHLNRNVGYVCVRVDRPLLTAGGNDYKASFSFCSPNDAPDQRHMLNRNFKSLARKIADDRMRTSRVKAHVDFKYERSPDKKLPDLFRHALKSATDVPKWFSGDNAMYGLEYSA